MTESTSSSAECSEPSCREAVDELFTFLDGQLTDDRRTAIQGHLDDCSHCLEQFDFHAELKQVVSEKCRTELPDGLKDRVFAALRALDD